MIYLIIIILILLSYGLVPSFLLKKINYFRRKRTGNTIYLTFDDGPSKYTLELLDLLKKYNVKATFFVVANYADDNKKIIERMKNEGHIIALHSLKHKSELLELPHQTIRDIKKSMSIMNNLNIDIKYFRAPWGQFNLVSLLLLKKYKIKIKLWNVMAEDWEAETTSDIISEKLINRVFEGDIICLHDGRGKNDAPKRTIKALDETIPKLLAKGYKFEVFDE